MYALFYRRHFCNGGWARFSGGFTNDSEGLIGADALTPLTQCLALNTNFNYRIPNEATDAANARQEQWDGKELQNGVSQETGSRTAAEQ